MLVKLFLEEGDPLFEYILGATDANDLIPSVMEFPRFNLETRLVMEHCGRIDPEDIHDYMAEGGYATLADALERSPAGIICEPSRPQACAGAAEPAFRRVANGHSHAKQRDLRRSSSATPTRVTPAPTWTAPSWKAILISSSRG